MRGAVAETLVGRTVSGICPMLDEIQPLRRIRTVWPAEIDVLTKDANVP
jgi:hypothetical protein